MGRHIKLCVVTVALIFTFVANESRAQSISVTSGRYSQQTDYQVSWNGSYSLPPGVTTYSIQTYIRPTGGSWSQGSASYFNLNWSGYGTTNPAAAGSEVVGGLWYFWGGQWNSLDSNVFYIDSPYN